MDPDPRSGLAVPRGAMILVTGSTGSVGGVVANKILKAGYKVRAIVRNMEKVAYLEELFSNRYGPDVFQAVHSSSLTDPDALEAAMQGCAAVVHVASDLSATPNPEGVITPTVRAAQAMLEAASKTPSIKRFVFTSSTATLPDPHEAGHITASSWAPEAVVESAWSAPHSHLSQIQNGLLIYAASKILAERACWDFVRERSPQFVLNTVVLSANLGAFVHPRLVSSFNGLILGGWKGGPDGAALMKMVMSTVGVHYLINLEDSGLLHLAALMLDDVRGERILAVGDPFNYNDILDVMGKKDPERTFPDRLEIEPQAVATVENTRYKELLARLGKGKPTGLEDSFRQAIATGP